MFATLDRVGRLAVTIPEAAVLASVAVNVIRKANERGELDKHYPSSHPIICVDDLRAWVKSLPTTPGGTPRRLSEGLTPLDAVDRIAVSIPEAAALSGVAVTIIRHANTRGELEKHYPSKSPIIYVDDILAWIKSLPMTAPPKKK